MLYIHRRLTTPERRVKTIRESGEDRQEAKLAHNPQRINSKPNKTQIKNSSNTRTAQKS